MKALVTLDAWKLEIFEKALRAAGFPFENRGEQVPGVIFLEVDTDEPARLHRVLAGANQRAAELGPPNS